MPCCTPSSYSCFEATEAETVKLDVVVSHRTGWWDLKPVFCSSKMLLCLPGRTTDLWQRCGSASIFIYVWVPPQFSTSVIFVHVKKAEFFLCDLPWGDNKFTWRFRLARLAAFKWFGFSIPENCFLTHGTASVSSVRENWPFCLGSPLCLIPLFSEKRWVWVSLIIILLKVKLVPLTASERSRSFKLEREGVN